MQVFKQIKPLRAYLASCRKPGFSIGLVPTMGALHAGHLSLVARSKAANPLTLASVFVNPAQFNNPDDLKKYPRTIESDLAQLETAGCDAVFIPEVPEIYPHPSTVSFRFPGLDDRLEGEFRPGHFNGVALVVAKLFHIIEPQRAYFGQKDFQQYLVISQLVRDLSFPIELMACPTVREADGLAMSSRNQRLNPQERKAAGCLYQTLQTCRNGLTNGQAWPPVYQHAITALNQAGLRPEYLALTDRENLNPVACVEANKPAVLLVAAYAGNVRLIDNLLI